LKINELKKLCAGDKKVEDDLTQMFSSLQNIFPSELTGNQILTQVLLTLIDFFKSQNETIAEVVTLKQKLDSNDIKVKVLSDLIQADSGKTTNILQEEKDQEPLVVEEDEDLLESLRLHITQEEDKSLQLDTELKNLRARNTMIQKEAKKNQEAIRLIEIENYDSRIADLMNQIREIEEEVALFTA